MQHWASRMKAAHTRLKSGRKALIVKIYHAVVDFADGFARMGLWIGLIWRDLLFRC
jgi:hypothetical protein